MSEAPNTLPAQCPNCDAALAGIDPPPAFCPRCGQETTLQPPRLLEFVHEFVAHYVAIDGALWRSLVALLFRPGLLTREYLAGRRRRYVLPLRLYLTASFVFFLIVKLLGAGTAMDVTFALGVDREGRPITLSQVQGDAEQWRRLRSCVQTPDACSAQEVVVARVAARIDATDPKMLRQQFSSVLPYAVFLLLPLFAGFVGLAYRGRRIAYGEHFVFGLHMHAAWFVAMLGAAWLPDAALPVVWLLVAVHGVVALRRVYGGRLWATLARAGVVSLLYLMALVATLLALLVIAFALS